MRGHFATLVVAGALGVTAHFAGERASAAKNTQASSDELMYLPEGRVLRMASLGHRNLLADFVWLRAIQYYGEHRLTDRVYDEAERIFDVIYQLDPTFSGATRFGALVLAQDVENPEAAIAFLERARLDQPHRWEYPFDQGFIYQTIVSDYERAGDAYRRAAAIPGAPDLAARLAGLSYAKLGDREAEREVWQSILEEDVNDLIKRMAARNLDRIAMLDAEDFLTTRTREFREDFGRWPESWQELVQSGYVDAIPREPFGGQYFLDPEQERVRASTSIDRRMATIRDILANAVAHHRRATGKFPASFEQLLARGEIDALPEAPFGVQVSYDPRTGVVAWNPPWPATEPRNHGPAPRVDS